MITVRMVWHFQGSAYEKAKAADQKIQLPTPNKLRGVRSYESLVGPGNTIALEWDFDCMADYEEFLPQFFAFPENAEGLAEWPDAISSTTEIWQLTYKE